MPSLLKGFFARYLPILESELRDLLAIGTGPYAGFYAMLHYHMGWLDAELRPTAGQSGKRVRPILCLLACQAAGGDVACALLAAAGIEILHNFSLIHDDIEDNSVTRRGRPTIWSVWGQPQAINAGDGMYALAQLAFARLPQRGVPVERAFIAQHVFNETCLALTHGQHLDISFEDRLDVTTEEYVTMITGKTAALIAASAHLGALLAGAGDKTTGLYRDFGFHLGLAFQIQDDILGIWGDTHITGKSTSTDIETRKKSLPVVYGLERSKALRQLYAQDAVAPNQVAQVVQVLDELGARQMAATLASEHHRKAIESLQGSGAAGEAGGALEELATNLLARDS